MAEDIVKSMMEKTGLSVIDLLAATVEIARREYPSELVRSRDQILQGLYRSVKCLECNDVGIEQVAQTCASVAETETDKTKVSDAPQVVLKDISNQEQLPERRRRLIVVIPLRKKKNPSLEATERPKSESHETMATKGSTITESNEMNQFQKNVWKKEDFMENNLEKAKRKLRENYELVACAKKKRCVKILSINELPNQGISKPQHKDVKRAPSRPTSRIQSKRTNLNELSTNEKMTSKYRSAGGLLTWEE